jgi:hypothetical protein
MIHDEWGEKGLEDNLLKYPKLRHIPFMVIWGIWKYRNKRLFKNWARQDSSIGKKFFFISRNFTMRQNLIVWIISLVQFILMTHQLDSLMVQLQKIGAVLEYVLN